MSCKDVRRTIAPIWRSSARILAVALLVLLGWPARGVAQGEGSNSGDLSRRVRYDIDYLTMGTGPGMQHSHVLILLTRGQVDTLQPTVDSATTAREQHAAEEAGRGSGHNSEAIPFGGHWYAATFTTDSMWVLGRALRRPGADTTFVVMVDHADHVGGEPQVTGVATITTPFPATFWKFDTDPIRQNRILTSWLQRAPLVGEYLR